MSELIVMLVFHASFEEKSCTVELRLSLPFIHVLKKKYALGVLSHPPIFQIVFFFWCVTENIVIFNFFSGRVNFRVQR